MRLIFVHLTFTAKRPIPPEYPKELKTLGDYIRKERLDRGLHQKEVAEIIGVTTDTITGWELGRHQPPERFYPKIFQFMGYDPLESKGEDIGSLLRNYRRRQGIPIKRMQTILRMDRQTILKIENRRSNIEHRTFNRVQRFLCTNDATL